MISAKVVTESIQFSGKMQLQESKITKGKTSPIQKNEFEDFCTGILSTTHTKLRPKTESSSSSSLYRFYILFWIFNWVVYFNIISIYFNIISFHLGECAAKTLSEKIKKMSAEELNAEVTAFLSENKAKVYHCSFYSANDLFF